MRIVIVAVVLAGCGGGQEETPRRPGFFPDAGPVTIASVFGTQSPVITAATRVRAATPVAAAATASQPVPAVATSEDAVFTVEDELGHAAGSLELRSIRGKGFPELRLLLRARRIGETSPPAPVRPACRETTRCSYPLTLDYTVTLSDDRFLQLVPRDEGIAVVARVIGVDAPVAAEIVFSRDHRVVSRRRVILLAG